MRLEQEPTARPASAPKGGWSQYTQLSRQLKQAGLLDRRHGWYAARIGLNLALLAAGAAAFAILGESWWQLVTAAYLAVVFTQLTFVATVGVRCMIDGVADAIAFYTAHLGFTLEHDATPAFAAVSRDGVQLPQRHHQRAGWLPDPAGGSLRQRGRAVPARPLRSPPLSWGSGLGTTHAEAAASSPGGR